MSQENLEVVRGAIACEYYAVGDRAEAEAIFDPHVVLNLIDEAASSGFAAMRADMERWASAFDDLKVTFEDSSLAAVRLATLSTSRRQVLPTAPCTGMNETNRANSAQKVRK